MRYFVLLFLQIFPFLHSFHLLLGNSFLIFFKCLLILRSLLMFAFSITVSLPVALWVLIGLLFSVSCGCKGEVGHTTKLRGSIARLLGMGAPLSCGVQMPLECYPACNAQVVPFTGIAFAVGCIAQVEGGKEERSDLLLPTAIVVQKSYWMLEQHLSLSHNLQVPSSLCGDSGCSLLQCYPNSTFCLPAVPPGFLVHLE